MLEAQPLDCINNVGHAAEMSQYWTWGAHWAYFREHEPAYYIIISFLIFFLYHSLFFLSSSCFAELLGGRRYLCDRLKWLRVVLGQEYISLCGWGMLIVCSRLKRRNFWAVCGGPLRGHRTFASN
jgi:hypothetical protein